MKDDRVYLRHILDAIKKIESYVAAGRDAFLASSHWQDAVIRQLEIMGEATKKLSSALRSRHPLVPWRRIAGLRDVLIHDYMGVDVETVWAITQNEVPTLKEQLQAVLRELDSAE